MPRLQLLELEDQPWCPRVLRDGATSYLAAAMRMFRVYDVVAPLLHDALRTCGSGVVVDLCSGGGGPWLTLAPALAARGIDIELALTDLAPNVDALDRLASALPRAKTERDPVDARAVPATLRGFRTLFTSFHHFRPHEARAILHDAALGEGIGVFEVTQRSVMSLLAILPSPLFVWLLTPWIRPFRWSRLLFTYPVPLIPLLVLFDGVVSVLRSYTAEELLEMAREEAPAWSWRAGVVRGRAATVTYLLGVRTAP